MNKSIEVLAKQANKLYASGKYKQVKKTLNEILALQPNNDSVLNMLAFAENQCGNRSISHQLLDKALSINPSNIQSYDLKGFLHAEDQDYKEAQKIYEKALSLNPNLPAIQKNLGMIYFRQGNYPSAIKHLGQAVLLQPDNKEFKQLYTSASADCPLSEFGDNDKKAIIVCLEDSALSHKFLSNNWTLILYNDPIFKILKLKNIEDLDKKSFFENLEEFKKTLNDPFILLGLQRNYIANLYYESVFTNLRRIFLELIVNDNWDSSDFNSVLSSLAIQCWINEYVFTTSSEEEKLADNLCLEIEKKGDIKNIEFNKLLLLACYKPLYHLKNASELIEHSQNLDNKIFKTLISLQITQPLEEQEIKTGIPLLNSIEDKVSTEVQGQYEQNPYPRWQSINNDQNINIMSDKPLDILVAGCGTGQEPASLTQVYPKAKFTCIDLSLSSIAYAVRQTKKLGLQDRMSFMQADILDLDMLDKKFDVIYSSGVLHHMADPESGLQVLNRLLKLNGNMYISLYSEGARKNVVAARQYIADHNIPSTPAGIRKMREIIKNTDDLILKKSTEVSDFFTLSQCRDLIFHVQEHRFTLPNVQEMLLRNDLKFGGMFALMQQKLQKFKEKYSNESDLLDINKWAKFEEENPDLFEHGMYSLIFEKKI